MSSITLSFNDIPNACIGRRSLAAVELSSWMPESGTTRNDMVDLAGVTI
jgi:hypothetical protein